MVLISDAAKHHLTLFSPSVMPMSLVNSSYCNEIFFPQFEDKMVIIAVDLDQKDSMKGPNSGMDTVHRNRSPYVE